MAASAFEVPLRRLMSEFEWLREEFARSASNQGSRHSQLACEMAVIRLYDSWARFCRELIIMSAYGKTLTLGGMRLKTSLPAIKSKALVVPTLMSTFKKQVYEPDWERADKCIDAGRRLKIMNISTVSAAIGAMNSPADEIRHVRNFFAHRRKGSSANALGTGYFPNLHRPVVFKLNESTPGRGTVIDYWIRTLLAIAFASAQ
jgi:hypothetical protein